MLAKVNGGTNAGCAMHRRVMVPKTGWACVHGHANPWYAARCLTGPCREKRT